MTDDARYWLLADATPIGPVTFADLHARLADGSVTGETKVCRVGDATWVPLFSLPGVGPPAVPEEVRVPSDSSPLPGSSDGVDASPDVTRELRALPRPIAMPVARPIALPVTPDPKPLVTGFIPEPAVAAASAGAAKPKGASEWVGVLVIIGVAAAVGYGVYTWLSPLSPRDVAQRFMDATTAASAKAYAVPSFHRAVDDLYRGPVDSDPTDEFRLTTEMPFPEGHFVGFQGRCFLPDPGRRVEIQGTFVLTQRGGWKVHDVIYFSVDGRRLDPPHSLAAAIPGVDRPPVPLDAAKNWYEHPPNRRAAILGGGFLSLKLLPKLLLGLGAIAAAVWAVIPGMAKASAKRPPGRV